MYFPPKTKRAVENKPTNPALSIVLTGMRVPASIILSSTNLLGLNGVWWSISMSSVLKGIAIVLIFYYMVRKKGLLDEKIMGNVIA